MDHNSVPLGQILSQPCPKNSKPLSGPWDKTLAHSIALSHGTRPCPNPCPMGQNPCPWDKVGQNSVPTTINRDQSHGTGQRIENWPCPIPLGHDNRPGSCPTDRPKPCPYGTSPVPMGQDLGQGQGLSHRDRTMGHSPVPRPWDTAMSQQATTHVQTGQPCMDTPHFKASKRLTCVKTGHAHVQTATFEVLTALPPSVQTPDSCPNCTPCPNRPPSKRLYATPPRNISHTWYRSPHPSTRPRAMRASASGRYP